jgi:hypothetical protein
MTQQRFMSLYRRSEGLIDLLIPDRLDLTTGTEYAESYDILHAPNWDQAFVPLEQGVICGIGFTSPSVPYAQRLTAGGGAPFRGKTRVVLVLEDYALLENDLQFFQIQANYPTQPPDLSPIHVIATSNQYRVRNAGLVLSGAVSAPTVLELPALCSGGQFLVTAGTALAQFGKGAGVVTISSGVFYSNFGGQFSQMTLDGGATLSASLVMNPLK